MSFVYNFIYLFLERGTGGEKRERNISALEKHQLGASPTPPNWGPGPQPRHMPQRGIELATFQLAGWHPVHWATPAKTRAFHVSGDKVRDSIFWLAFMSEEGVVIWFGYPANNLLSEALFENGISIQNNSLDWPGHW